MQNRNHQVSEKLLTCKEVAEIFRVKQITVWDWIRKGKMPAVRYGKFYLVKERDVKRAMRARNACGKRNADTGVGEAGKKSRQTDNRE